MKVQEILTKRQRPIVTSRVEDTIETAAMLLASNNIGAVPVRDSKGGLVGVLSERDIVRGLADKGGQIHKMTIGDLMTSNVITCTPDDDAKYAANLMAQRHIRHLPVVDDGKLIGMISSRDVMENQLEQAKLERNVLRDYALTNR